MEKSAKTISTKKFIRLSVKARHELFVELAEVYLENRDLDGFRARYEELSSLVSFDYFNPPHWLTSREALLATQSFHQSFLPTDTPSDMQTFSTSWEAAFPVTLILEGIRSPYNLGSMFRLADNFGLEGILATCEHPSPKHAQCHKAARGSEKWIPYRVVSDLVAFLKSRNRPLIVLECDPKAVSIHDWELLNGFNLLVGNEANGVSEKLLEMADQIVSIPMLGFKSSMNVTHATTCLLSRLKTRPIDHPADQSPAL